MNTHPRHALKRAFATAMMTVLVPAMGLAKPAPRTVKAAKSAPTAASVAIPPCDRQVAADALAHRRAFLLRGPLAPSVAPVRDLIAQALRQESDGNYAAAQATWGRAYLDLITLADKASQRDPEAGFAEFDQRKTALLPDILQLDLGRAYYQQLAAQGRDTEVIIPNKFGGKPNIKTLTAATEICLQGFHESYTNRRDKSGESMGTTPMPSTPDQESALAEDFQDCMKLLAAIQGNLAARVATWPRVHILEDNPATFANMGSIHVRLISGIATSKAAKGDKYVAIYFASEVQPRFMMPLTEAPIKWDLSGYPAAERRRLAQAHVLDVKAASATEDPADSKLGIGGRIVAVFTPNSGNIAGFSIYHNAIGFVHGGD